MTFSITVEQSNGEFVASVPGQLSLRVARPTRDAAIAELQRLLVDEVRAGRLTSIEVPAPSRPWAAGRLAGDPTMREICNDIYRKRDAQPKE